MTTQLRCCKIGCEALADYEIREVGRPREHTHSCLDHIPGLMSDATVHEIVKLVAPGDPTPVYV